MLYRSALLGRDIGYTRSPQIHAAISRVIGERIDFSIADVPYDGLDAAAERLLKDCDGFFVTKPYKHDIKRYLASCETVCGVNFVSASDKRGYNTDGTGFIRALDRAFSDWRSRVSAALILGAGGAASSVAEALVKSGKKTYVLNRTVMTAAKLCKTIGAELYLNQPAQLVVNATTLGLHGEDVMRALCVMPTFDYAFDLNYTPSVTPFMKRNASCGAKTANGADMLIYPAIEGDALLTGKDLDIQSVYDGVVKILAEQNN